MGMFDSVYVNCKDCGTKIEFQSKVGECCLHEYSLNDAPHEILLDLNGEIQICGNCDAYNMLKVYSSVVGGVV